MCEEWSVEDGGVETSFLYKVAKTCTARSMDTITANVEYFNRQQKRVLQKVVNVQASQSRILQRKTMRKGAQTSRQTQLH